MAPVYAFRTYWHSDAIDKGYPVNDRRETRTRVAREEDANLVASLLQDGRHAPAFDLDLPCTLIPSSTAGHFHLLIDAPMSWRKYRKLLRALVKAGLVEKKYYKHSKRRGMSMLRLPHVHKGVDYRSPTLDAVRRARAAHGFPPLQENDVI